MPAWGGCNGQYNKQGKKSKNRKRKAQQQTRHPPSQAGLISYHKDNNEREKERKPNIRVSFEAAAGIGPTRSLDRFHLLIVGAPCYPICRLLPAFVDRCFITTVALAFSFPWAPRTADAWRFPLASDSSLYHLIIYRSAASRPPWYHCSAIFAVLVPTAVSTPNNNGQSFVDPSRNTQRFSTINTHLCDVFSCPPDLRPSPPVILVNITRLGNLQKPYIARPRQFFQSVIGQ